MTRKSLLKKIKTVVVKVGTNVLSDDEGRLDDRRVRSLARQIEEVRASGREAILVSSGAIGAGMAELGLMHRPDTLPELQAAAAVGQARLIHTYNQVFAKHGSHAAQVLLTRQDFDDRGRYLNVRHTLRALLRMNAVPIVNENDTVSVDEIRFGDNDLLSALVTNLLPADALILLTVVDGLHDETGAVVPQVERITDRIRGLDSGTVSSQGTGGMRTKLEAATMVTEAGEAVFIANGTRPDVLSALLAGEEIGTLFLPAVARMSSRKRWIGMAVHPKGEIRVDDGARRALLKGGKSLLPSGICEVVGPFRAGDIVAVTDAVGQPLARGRVNYSSSEVEQIRGHRSTEIASILGACAYEEVVHRDNLTLLGAQE